MKVYDNYEISPCRRHEEPDSPDKFYFEVCEPEGADVWTLYGHINGEGAEAIGDFSTREATMQVYSRITGQPFAGSYQADAHLWVMHAGPKLLEALIAASHWIDAQLGKPRSDIQAKVQAAIAEATGGGSSPAIRKPIVIEVRGGVVQDVHNLPPGYDYEVKDYGNIEADEAASGSEDGSNSPSALPPDPEGMNDKRAGWAGRAIAAFREATGTDKEDALADLLADLMHWADRNHQDFDAALDRGRWHYEAETGGKDGL